MLTTFVVASLATILFFYIAIPLLLPAQADPLPNLRDPLEEDLEEERDALFRAIRELELREDLAPARRDALRARYEGKAARVLRALDERQATLRGQVSSPLIISKRPPYAVLALLVLMIASGSVLGGYVLPRVGSGTLTTADARDLERGRELQRLQRAVSNDPSPGNLLTLGDAYWDVENFADARSTYERYAGVSDELPLRVYQRLGFLIADEDPGTAIGYLEQARSLDAGDADTLFALGNLYALTDRMDEATAAWEALLLSPNAAAYPQVAVWLETARVIGPLLARAQAEPSEANLLALADTYWNLQEYQAAMNVYFQVLTQHDPQHVLATSRIGQTLFMSGRYDDAAAVLERARTAAPDDLQTLLFLGNSYFSLERFDDAIATWEDYIRAAGGPERAGRVPSLIADAQARLGNSPAAAPVQATVPVADAALPDAQALYSQNCAGCHGMAGQGGAGPLLANNPRAQDPERVARIIRDGRGMMPAFGLTLSEAELSALTDYVTTELAGGSGQ